MSDSDIIQEFLVESSENLDRLDRELVGLEKNPQDRDALASVFRTIHTIKGTCGFLGFSKLEKLAHVGENLLSRLRDGQLTLNPEITTALLTMVDAVRQMLNEIQSTGNDGDRAEEGLIATLTQLQQPPEPKAEDAAALVDPAASLGDILMQRAGVTAPQIDRAIEAQNAGDPRRLGEILVEQKVVKASDIVDALHLQQAARKQAAAVDSTIRVDVVLLDKLMNLAGELVLACNQTVQFTNKLRDPGMLATSQRLNQITSELQESVMKTRMQPIGNIWGQFPRTVRDVALACGKQVNIEMEGKETELDKTIIEAIKDPLTHLVRNSVDHGIELPEDRIKAGKQVAGRLILRAFHEGGQVNIEISDDGAGLNCDRIRQKAVERGLITAEQAARMSERESFDLIFLPGFSTAAKVTNVSGRGVGMDVVKTNVEKIGGVVDVQSVAGRGTTVRVKIPLTLAIIPALVVTCGGDRYAIPQVSLLELVRLEAEQSRTAIEKVHGAPVYRLRGRLLPLVYLRHELQLADSTDGSQRDAAVNIVVLQADGRRFGLVVDQINDTVEIVAKPLGKQLKVVNTFAGATIMGDGKVALILDALRLAQRANVVSQVVDRTAAERDVSITAKATGNRQTLLLFQAGKNGRMALPLSLVARLEEFAASAVENAGRQRVVQYRGQIMPLVRISEVVQGSDNGFDAISSSTTPDVQSPLQVVVYAEQGRSVGLQVERILDIVEEEIVLDHPAERVGVLGSAVVQQRVTDLLDVQASVRVALPGYFDRVATASNGN
jgi:two-component system, chemotaxis family, sensor kinase CheA